MITSTCLGSTHFTQIRTSYGLNITLLGAAERALLNREGCQPELRFRSPEITALRGRRRKLLFS